MPRLPENGCPAAENGCLAAFSAATAGSRQEPLAAVEPDACLCCLSPDSLPWRRIRLPWQLPRAVDLRSPSSQQTRRAERGGMLGRLDRCGYASA